MNTNSTGSGNRGRYGVRVSVGQGPMDEESRLHRQDSVTSGSPTSRLEKALEGDDSGSEDRMVPRLKGVTKAYVKSGRNSREVSDLGEGILRTTEVSVTR